MEHTTFIYRASPNNYKGLKNILKRGLLFYNSMNFQTSSYGVARVVTSKYNDGNLAVLLNDEFGSPIAKLSVNLPDCDIYLAENQFFAKTYSENAEIAEDALASGLFKQTTISVKNGWVTLPIWEIIAP